MAETYREKLRRPEWRNRRDEIEAAAGHQCQQCGVPRSDCGSLEVHHKYYLRGRDPWDYPDEALMCVCRRCHEELGYRDDEVRVIFAALNDSEIERLLVEARRMLRERLGYEEAREFLVLLSAC